MASRAVITIIGTGLIGGSIGMALLKNRGKDLDVLGHDKDFGQAGLARKMGAITKVERNLHSACEKADMIVVAIPASEIRETLELIAEDLKTGCVITDTASLKAPVLEWADECLPESVSFVGGDPILFGDEAGLDMARPDLFEKKQYCLTPSTRASSDGVKLVTDLVSMMGAIPHFIDPHEHDGLIGGSEHLAGILAVTLLQTLSTSGGWRDMRRICGATFDRVTCFSMSDPAEYRDRALYNRENVMRWIDSFQQELSQIRQHIEEEDGEAIAERYDSQMDVRIKWLHDRDTQDWGDMPRSASAPSSGAMMSQMLFGGLGRRRSEDE